MTLRSHPFFLLRSSLLFLFFITLSGTSLWGQVSSRTESDATIRDIRVAFIGLENVNEELIYARIAVEEGGPFDEALVDKSIRSLYASGLFEFIEVRRDEISVDQVDLVFRIKAKYRVLAVFYEGNQRIKDRRLERETDTRANQALNERLVKNDAEAIYDYYQKKGFTQVNVDYEIDRDPETGFGEVVFRIDEGNKTRIAKIEFMGNDSISSRKLRKEMETRKWHIFSWLTGSGRFKDEDFREDIPRLLEYYREEGFLDVAIAEEDIVISYPEEGRMRIEIPVEEGRRYQVGEMRITGNEIFETPILMSTFRIKPGDVFVPSKVDDQITRLSDFYGSFGYLDTRVNLERIPNLETGAIDLLFTIRESERFFVESIVVEGNTKSKSVVILRELSLAPGMVFDQVRMKLSKSRLDNTGWFDSVETRDEPINIPNRRNLKVSVQEGRTGNLTFGAGFSSVENVVGFVEVSQGNFDIFNWRSFFQGDGQKLRIRLQIGSDSNEALLYFEEPYFLDSFFYRLGFGFQIFRTETDYNSTLYNELRTGYEVFFRKNLIELIEGRIAQRWESVDIFDVSPFAPDIITDLAGEQIISKFIFTLTRDTRNSLVTPTRGSRYELTQSVATPFLGGDYEYYSIEMRAAKWFPTFEWQNQVLSLIGRTGTVLPYGDSDEVPFFDRYFLGGPNSLRGFDYRDVGPKDPQTGEPVGGKTYAFFSAEYSIEIAQPVRFAVFYDAGYANKGKGDWDPENFNDNWGFGIRLFVMGAPLRLDYGIPITTDDFNDEGNQFHFSFGTRF